MKNTKHPNLLSPIKIGKLTFKNRMCCSPSITMDDYDAEGYLIHDYFERKAAGGAASVCIGEARVMPSGHLKKDTTNAIFNRDCVALYGRLADLIHRHGAIASVELTHEGAGEGNTYSFGEDPDEGKAMGPSALKNPWNGVMGREMTEEDIYRVIDAFGTAAAHVKQSGFDMVTVHAGHGWLIAQFLSPLTNHRTDKWGGSQENRLRFLELIIEDIRQKCGKDFPIELRISGEELTPGGITIDDCVDYCKRLDGKVDLFHISCTSIFDMELGGRTTCSPSPYDKPGRNVWLAAEVKKHVKTPVAAIGSIVDPDMMEEIIASGKADIIAASRTFIADPDFPKKTKAGRTDEIRPCLRCLGCLDDTLYGARAIRCAVNPIIGREASYCHLAPSAVTRDVLVVGGGFAGMQAAITASERGHRVTLCEKSGELGGVLSFAAKVPFKADIERYRQWMIRTLKNSKVKLLMNTEVTPELVAELHPEVLICAVGARDAIPPIPGVDGKNVVPATQYHADGVEIGKKVVVVGGGLVGCETAIDLRMGGHNCTVLEMADEILPGVQGGPKEYTWLNMGRSGVKSVAGVRVTAIDETGVHAERDGEKLFFEADTVIISVGQTPLEAVRESLRDTADQFVAVGDCYKIGRIKEATGSAYAAAVYID